MNWTIDIHSGSDSMMIIRFNSNQLSEYLLLHRLNSTNAYYKASKTTKIRHKNFKSTQKQNVKLAKQDPNGTGKNNTKEILGEKTSKSCKTCRWIKNVVTQNAFKRNNEISRDIRVDVFAHIGRCRIIPSRLRDFTNGSEQRGLSEITTNSNTSNIKSDGQHYELA